MLQLCRARDINDESATIICWFNWSAGQSNSEMDHALPLRIQKRDQDEFLFIYLQNWRVSYMKNQKVTLQLLNIEHSFISNAILTVPHYKIIYLAAISPSNFSSENEFPIGRDVVVPSYSFAAIGHLLPGFPDSQCIHSLAKFPMRSMQWLS